MAGDGFSLISLDGASDVVIKLLDMVKDAVGWVASPHGAQIDFNDALVVYKKSIEDGNEADGIVKAAKMASARKDLRKYLNTGKIISYAIPVLDEDAKMEVDSDWLAYFFDYAENISDDSIQKIWARILAEQCNGDTSIKRTLIHILSLLDSRTAKAFGKLCRITFKYPLMPIYEHFGTKFLSEYIPLVIGSKISGLHLAFPEGHELRNLALEYRACIPEPNDIAILQEIGLIELPEKRETTFEYPFNFGLVHHDYSGKGNKYKSTTIQDYIVEYFGVKYRITPKSIEGCTDLEEIQEKLPKTIKFGTVKFTTVGESLYKMIPSEHIDGFDSMFRFYLNGQEFNVEEI